MYTKVYALPRHIPNEYWFNLRKSVPDQRWGHRPGVHLQPNYKNDIRIRTAETCRYSIQFVLGRASINFFFGGAHVPLAQTIDR